MNDDIERRLRLATPRGAPPELRARVLAALADELRSATPLPSRRPFRPALAVAASLIAGLILNYRVNSAIDRRLAIVLGPAPVQKQAAEIADDIAAITDPATGRWAYEKLAAGRPDDHAASQYPARLQRMIQQLTVDFKETANEATQKDPQMDRDRRGSRDRHPAIYQCVFRLEHRYRA